MRYLISAHLNCGTVRDYTNTRTAKYEGQQNRNKEKHLKVHNPRNSSFGVSIVVCLREIRDSRPASPAFSAPES